MSLDADTFIELVDKSIERDNLSLEKMLLHRWGYELPFMETAMQFEEYKGLAFGTSLKSVKESTSNSKDKDRLSSKSNDEILKRIEEVKKIDQARNGGGDKI